MRVNAGLFGILLISIAVFIALFIGLAAAIIPWWLAIILFSPPLIIWAAAKWPLIAICITMLAANGFLPFGLVFSDFVVVSFVAFIFFIFRKNIYSTINNFKHLSISLSLLMLWGLLMIVYGYFINHNFLYYVYTESITLAYWMLMPAFMLICHDDKFLKSTGYTLIVLTCIMCIFSIIQSIFHWQLNFTGLKNFAELTSEEGGIAGIARVHIPASISVLFLFVLSIANLINKEKKPLMWFFLLALTGMAIFVSFGRAFWAASAMAAFIVAFLSGKRPFFRFILLVIISLILLFATFNIIYPDIIIGIQKRILSVFSEFSGDGNSYRWRLVENHFALISIENNPVLGLGPGGVYKPRLIDFRIFANQMFYIHNAYYYVTLKFGLIGMILYLAHFFGIMIAGFKNSKTNGIDANPQRALIATFISILLLNFTQPEFMQGASIASMASISAVVLCLGYRQKQAYAARNNRAQASPTK